MLTTIIIFVLTLSLLVVVHEWGHFFAARRCGVRVHEFALGFPPRISAIRKKASGKGWQVLGREVPDFETHPSTTYSLNALPLGGFVRIKGEAGDHAGDRDSFSHKPFYQKVIILSAGVAMNVVLALVFVAIVLAIPTQRYFSTVPHGAQVQDARVVVLQVKDGSAAAQAGIRAGDLILSIEGNTLAAPTDVDRYVSANPLNTSINILIERGGAQLPQSITPQYDEQFGRAVLGVALAGQGIVRLPWYRIPLEAVRVTGDMLHQTYAGFFQLVVGVLQGRGVGADVAGPVGIAVMTGDVARAGVLSWMQFVALLSINLAVLNIIPFPALDGGRILFAVLEKIRGKSLRKEWEGYTHAVGFAVLMLLAVVVTYRDIARYAGNWLQQLFG